MLVEFVGGPPGHPPFTHYILQKFWEVGSTGTDSHYSKNCKKLRSLVNGKVERKLEFYILRVGKTI